MSAHALARAEAPCPHCRRWREEAEEALEEARQLRALLFGEQHVERLMLQGFTQIEARVLAVLLSRESASKQAIHNALYSADANGGADLKIVDVIVCKARAKLPEGAIKTLWGLGYQLTTLGRAALGEAAENSPAPLQGGAGRIAAAQAREGSKA